jgi:drug/metabolite transporter (DMT)-like permease
VLLAQQMYFYDLDNAEYRKRALKYVKITGILLSVILVILTFQFKNEAQESVLFVLGVIFMLYSLILIAFYTINKNYLVLKQNATKFLIYYGVVYMSFFTLLAYLSNKAPFLIQVHNMIRNVMQ